ncbi:MAG: methyltransferase domain-containing protein [Bacteroidota bacterium]
MTTPADSTVQTQYDVALGLIDQGDFPNATVHLEEFLRQEPEHAAAHNDLGVLRFQAGDSTAALTHLLQALRLQPSNMSYAENIIDVCRSLGLNEHAAEMEKLLAQLKTLDTSREQEHPVANNLERPVVGGIDYNTLSQQPEAERNALLTWYWTFHPRFRFLKCLDPYCRVLDVGAGRGGMITWKEWLTPVRNDLSLYAVDLQPSELFAQYAGSQICNLDDTAVAFNDGFFGGAVLSHILEHITEPKNLMKELRRVMKTGGQMYIEVPTLASMDFPSRRAFVDAGIPVSTVNFFDDSTHRRTFGLAELVDIAEEARFRVVSSGSIRHRYVEDALLLHGLLHKDEELSTYGVWSRLGFAQYVIVEAV